MVKPCGVMRVGDSARGFALRRGAGFAGMRGIVSNSHSEVTAPIFTPVVPPTDPTAERELAWVGDAVLGLYAREDVLRRIGKIDTRAFLDLTSNAFLTGIGRPTRVEAEIGLVYRRDGLAAAFAYIEARVTPLWRAQEARRSRQRRG